LHLNWLHLNWLHLKMTNNPAARSADCDLSIRPELALEVASAAQLLISAALQLHRSVRFDAAALPIPSTTLGSESFARLLQMAGRFDHHLASLSLQAQTHAADLERTAGGCKGKGRTSIFGV
jgi:hypothetical protein